MNAMVSALTPGIALAVTALQRCEAVVVATTPSIVEPLTPVPCANAIKWVLHTKQQFSPRSVKANIFSS